MNEKYVFDQSKNLSELMNVIKDRPDFSEFCSSFYDCFKNNNNSTPSNGSVRSSMSGEAANRSWLWSWDPNHGRNFSIPNILDDNKSETGITLSSLRHALQKELEALKNC